MAVGVGVGEASASTRLIRRGVASTAISSLLINQKAKPEPNKRDELKAHRPIMSTTAIMISGSLGNVRFKAMSQYPGQIRFNYDDRFALVPKQSLGTRWERAIIL
jgi:hypothetical protein